jgi:hypothetical protein
MQSMRSFLSAAERRQPKLHQERLHKGLLSTKALPFASAGARTQMPLKPCPSAARCAPLHQQAEMNEHYTTTFKHQARHDCHCRALCSWLPTLMRRPMGGSTCGV